MQKQICLIILFSLSCICLHSQTKFEKEIFHFQDSVNQVFSNPDLSPLDKKNLKNFSGLDFYPPDSMYRVLASFTRLENATPFRMKTTTERLPVYEPYAKATFTLYDKEYELTIYQSHDLRLNPLFRDYLFLPFTDDSNGESTYGGGRYIGLHIPKGDSILIDFNKAYNPYCVYSFQYSCPIPPAENYLPIAVHAGLKMYKQPKKDEE